jgi:hypothetical protein
MKLFIVIVATVAFSSCNTCIGIGRDTVKGYEWTKSKFQGESKPQDEAVLPVY